MKETKTIRDILWSETTVGLTIASTIIGAVLFITGPDARMKKDIALLRQEVKFIQENELRHISQDIKEIKEDNKASQEKLREIELKLERVITLLEE